MAHYNQALIIRKKIPDTIGMASAYNNIGLCLNYQDKLDEAVDTLKTGLQLLQGKDTVRIMASLYNSLADCYRLQNDLFKARINLEYAKDIAESLGQPAHIARALNAIGMIDLELRNYQDAEDNFTASLRYSTQLEDTRGITATNVNMADVYFYKKMYDSALALYQKCLNNSKALEDIDIAAIHYNIGIIHRAKKQYRLAEEQLYKSQAMFTALEAPWQLSDISYELGNLNYDQSNFKKAELHYKQFLQAKEIEHDPLDLANTYYNLAETYFALNQLDSAFFYSQFHLIQRDSISSHRIKAAGLYTELEKTKKENALARADVLAAEVMQQKNDKLLLWNRGVIALAILFLGLLTTSILFYQNRQKRLEADFQLYIAEGEVDKAYRQVDDLLQNQELKMAYAKLEAKDETQRKMGKELHDRIGIMLSTVKLYFTELSDRLNTLQTDSKEKQFKAMELLDETVTEVRRISHDLQNGVLIKMGLAHAVKDLCEVIRESNQIKVELKMHGLKERIPNNLEVNIYRIVKELMANVLKHAKSSKLVIYMHRHEQLVNLIVEDDGIGFDPKQVTSKNGTGLQSIAMRVAELNGKIHFDSADRQGTSVVIDIPIPDINLIEKL